MSDAMCECTGSKKPCPELVRLRAETGILRMTDKPRTDSLRAKWSASEGSRNSTCSPEAQEIYALAAALERELAASKKECQYQEKAKAAISDCYENQYSRAEDALSELQIAVRFCCNQYWDDGHGARVKKQYGFDEKEEQK